MKNIRFFLSEIFHFAVVKFSVYLNRLVFVMLNKSRTCNSCNKSLIRVLWPLSISLTVTVENRKAISNRYNNITSSVQDTKGERRTHLNQRYHNETTSRKLVEFAETWTPLCNVDMALSRWRVCNSNNKNDQSSVTFMHMPRPYPYLAASFKPWRWTL